MADLIGGIAPYLGRNNLIFGTGDADNIYGDPYTEGNFEGLPPNAGILSSGKGGSDLLFGFGGGDTIVGDAGLISGTGRGGNDLILGGDGDDPFLIGDADNDMSENARGGHDQIEGGTGDDGLFGDSGNSMSGSARGGCDHLDGGLGRVDRGAVAALRQQRQAQGSPVRARQHVSHRQQGGSAVDRRGL